jgi:hypothetical protein
MLVSALLLAAAAGLAEEQTTTRVSTAASGDEGNAGCYLTATSADGRFVAFVSWSTNLVPGDTNGEGDVFLRDRLLDTIERVSVSSSGAEGNSGSGTDRLAVSSSGRYVVFDSRATNLVPGDTNGVVDVFVRDRVSGTTDRVSVSTAGQQGDGDSTHPAMDETGEYVVFQSKATNLVAGDTNGHEDVFIRDMQAGATYLISYDYGWGPANDFSRYPDISADGRYVAFHSSASDIVAGDTNDTGDIFVCPRSGATERVSVSTAGAEANGLSGRPGISADGRYVVFDSSATNLVAGDTNGYRDVFWRDRTGGTTRRISLSSTQAQGNGSSYARDMGRTGRFVTFNSYANNLVPNDTNSHMDVFARDVVTGTTERASLAWSGAQANSVCGSYAAISDNGRFVAFYSLATNLVPDDTNGCADVFFRDLLSAPKDLVPTER